MTERPDCKLEALCPWGIAPVMAMWAKVGERQFWGTDCVLYINCPRKNWSKKKWLVNRIAKKFGGTIDTPT
jgi:hypothetical protein